MNALLNRRPAWRAGPAALAALVIGGLLAAAAPAGAATITYVSKPDQTPHFTTTGDTTGVTSVSRIGQGTWLTRKPTTSRFEWSGWVGGLTARFSDNSFVSFGLSLAPGYSADLSSVTAGWFTIDGAQDFALGINGELASTGKRITNRAGGQSTQFSPNGNVLFDPLYKGLTGDIDLALLGYNAKSQAANSSTELSSLSFTLDITAPAAQTPIPEPLSAGLGMAGVFGVALRRGRRGV